MNNRADQLQFFRFCAFLLICAHHMGRCQLSWFPHGNGAATAVEFFIVLSGAVIGISSYKREIKCSFSNIFVYIKKKIKYLSDQEDFPGRLFYQKSSCHTYAKKFNELPFVK